MNSIVFFNIMLMNNKIDIFYCVEVLKNFVRVFNSVVNSRSKLNDTKRLFLEFLFKIFNNFYYLSFRIIRKKFKSH